MSPQRQRQRRFVEEYLKDRNGTQAAIRAGYGRAGASVQAVRLLRNARVRAAIASAGEAAAAIAKGGELAPTSTDGQPAALVLTLAEAETIASEIARDALATRRDRLAALDRMAKFRGWDAPDRHEVADGGELAELRAVAAAMTPEERAQWLQRHLPE